MFCPPLEAALPSSPVSLVYLYNPSSPSWFPVPFPGSPLFLCFSVLLSLRQELHLSSRIPCVWKKVTVKLPWILHKDSSKVKLTPEQNEILKSFSAQWTDGTQGKNRSTWAGHGVIRSGIISWKALYGRISGFLWSFGFARECTPKFSNWKRWLTRSSGGSTWRWCRWRRRGRWRRRLPAPTTGTGRLQRTKTDTSVHQLDPAKHFLPLALNIPGPLSGLDLQFGMRRLAFLGTELKVGMLGTDLEVSMLGIHLKVGMLGTDLEVGMLGTDLKVGMLGTDLEVSMLGTNLKVSMWGTDLKVGTWEVSRTTGRCSRSVVYSAPWARNRPHTRTSLCWGMWNQ